MSDHKLSVYGDWLVQEASGCTCQGSDAHYGHQPGCGYEPLLKLDEIKAALKSARIAVVELPDFDSLDHFEIRDGVVRQYDPNGFGAYREFTLAELPELAAALLAAEAVQS